jgi:hypothetical protein
LASVTLQAFSALLTSLPFGLGSLATALLVR